MNVEFSILVCSSDPDATISMRRLFNHIKLMFYRNSQYWCHSFHTFYTFITFNSFLTFLGSGQTWFFVKRRVSVNFRTFRTFPNFCHFSGSYKLIQARNVYCRVPNVVVCKAMMYSDRAGTGDARLRGCWRSQKKGGLPLFFDSLSCFIIIISILVSNLMRHFLLFLVHLFPHEPDVQR